VSGGSRGRRFTHHPRDRADPDFDRSIHHRYSAPILVPTGYFPGVPTFFPIAPQQQQPDFYYGDQFINGVNESHPQPIRGSYDVEFPALGAT